MGKWSCDSCMGCGRIGDSVRLCNSGIVVCSGGGGLGGDGGDCGHFDVASGGGNEEASLLRHGVFDSICLMPRVAVVGRGRCGSVVGEVMRWCFIVTYQIANFST